MQEHPHAVLLVQAQFDEVVAATEAAQLLAPLRGVVEVDAAGVGRAFQDADALGSVGVVDLAVVLARRQGDGADDLVAQDRQVDALEVVGGVAGTGGDHATPDVDANGCRDDGTDGGDDSANGGPLTGVSVGHEGDVRADERQLCQCGGLLAGGVVDDRREGQDVGGDLLGHGGTFQVVVWWIQVS